MAFLGFQRSGDAVRKADLEDSTKNYERIEVSEINRGDVEKWGAPKAQSHGKNWVFGVFTPPKIYKHPKTGDFTAVPYIEEKAPVFTPENLKPPFGVDFISMHQEPFPVILTSVIRNDANPSLAFIQLEYRVYPKPTPGVAKVAHIRDRTQTLQGGLKTQFDQQQIKILELTVQLVEIAGLPTEVETVTVQDLRDNRIYPLQKNRPLMTPNFWITLRSSSNSLEAPVFMKNPKPGTPLKLNGADYEIIALDIASRAVSLRKVYMHVPREGETPLKVVETKKLSLSAGSALPTPGTPPVPPNPVPGTIPLPGSFPLPAPAPPPPPPSSAVPSSVPVTPFVPPVPSPLVVPPPSTVSPPPSVAPRFPAPAQ